jgi:hypothetical protein
MCSMPDSGKQTTLQLTCKMRTTPALKDSVINSELFVNSKAPKLQTSPSDWQGKLAYWMRETTSSQVTDASDMLEEMLEVISPIKSPTRHIGFQTNSDTPQQPSALTMQGYKVGRQIGEGAFSKVKLATHILSNKQVRACNQRSPSSAWTDQAKHFRRPAN